MDYYCNGVPIILFPAASSNTLHKITGSLFNKHIRFWATRFNRKCTSWILGHWIPPNFRANRLYKNKERRSPYFRLKCVAQKRLCVSFPMTWLSQYHYNLHRERHLQSRLPQMMENVRFSRKSTDHKLWKLILEDETVVKQLTTDNL